MSNTRAPFSIRRRIEFANCDPAGIVFFVEFFRMCSTAFEEWLTDHLGIAFAEEFFVHDHMFPVVHADADFKKPLRMGDQLDIELVLTGLGRSSIHYTCIGRSAAEDVFRIKLVNSMGRRSTGQSIEIPDTLRGPMEAYLEASRAAAEI